jgi:hypothetical protein
MRIRTFLLVVAVALAAALAACGGEAIPGETRARYGPSADSQALVPAFAADGSVLREAATDLTICETRDGVREPRAAAPMFAADGRVLRCPETGAPLYRAERRGEPVLVRDGSR